jgi:3-methyl-2-oxobutanoate hydroxymethyltransferase
MPHIHVPVIGIGAGAATDGQVLVFHDLLGMHDGHTARFVQRYRNLRQEMIDGVRAFGADVRARRYPEPKHGYHMTPNEVERLQARLADMLPRKGRVGGNGVNRGAADAVDCARPPARQSGDSEATPCRRRLSTRR